MKAGCIIQLQKQNDKEWRGRSLRKVDQKSPRSQLFVDYLPPNTTVKAASDYSLLYADERQNCKFVGSQVETRAMIIMKFAPACAMLQFRKDIADKDVPQSLLVLSRGAVDVSGWIAAAQTTPAALHNLSQTSCSLIDKIHGTAYSTLSSANSAEAARASLEMHRRNGDQLFSRIVTGDESWVHHSTPETKRQSMVWKKPEESTPKKGKVSISAGKVMAIVFWDCKGVLLVDYLPPNTTVNAARYCENRWDETMKLANVVFYLKGTAGRWFDNNEESLNSWRIFEDAFRGVFGLQKDSARLVEEVLKSRAQKAEESSESYIQEILSLFHQVLVAKDIQRLDEILKFCRHLTTVKHRRIGRTKFARLSNVMPISCVVDSDDLAALIRRIVREEIQKDFSAPEVINPLREVNALEQTVREEVSRALIPTRPQISFEFVVMVECSHDIIFGWDFFKATEAVIDCDRNELHIRETSILESREEENQRLFASDDFVIPPKSIKKISVMNEEICGPTSTVKHKINTGDHSLIKQRPYRVAPSERRLIQDEVNKICQSSLDSGGGGHGCEGFSESSLRGWLTSLIRIIFNLE
ncbi:hypothetical protein LAZ67_1005210 [Cordylochernes scorpioides]|uniref:Retrotransposon gag domain-containing protein n=1 Tax=Cordylochernes scorpioides TaxID=51811 RepID=A0ABY6JY80_9ARAC|nr:hypothetical protein LAZ67_1005210 [Cordylochernes scorpioides]